MAVSKLWAVTSRLGQVIDYAANPAKTAADNYTKEQYQALRDVLAYAKDEEKTEREFFVEGINCNPLTARDQFVSVKQAYGKEEGIQAYHGYLSFKEQDISPELAQKIGMEFVNEVWGKRFQAVVTTHLNTKHFVDVIIKNTNGTGKSDRFWDSGEMNLLKALVLYVDLTYPPEQRNIGEVYNLITQCSESQLDSLFDVLPLTHPAKAPYSLYQRASDSVRSGVISGLGSRLQVFQSELIKKITAYDEISLELPGQQPCAYYLVTSDQDSTFDFLASLFLSFAFIKLVRYADANCPGGRLPVPVHVLGEELTACGTISELSRRISVIRSRNISMSCVFQNLAGLQNRYPQNQWQEILGNCDVQLFLGCTDQLTSEYVSQRTGIASVAVSSTSKALSTLRVSDYTPQYRESSGVGKRPVLTPDEVLRLPVDEALVILRGHKVLKVYKMDYSLHPAYKQLRECKASAHIPEWRKALPETPEAPPAETSKASPKVPPKRRGRPAKSKTVVATDKESIITKPENEKEISHGNEQ